MEESATGPAALVSGPAGRIPDLRAPRFISVPRPFVIFHGESTTIYAVVLAWSAGALAALSACWWATVVVPMDLPRTMLLAVVAGDLAVGFMIGLSSSTSAYYHANRRVLWTVLALNVAPPAALWFLFPIGGEFWPTLGAYALGGAFLLQKIENGELRRMIAAFLILIASGETIAGAGIPGEAQFLAVVYLLKILFSFSLRHGQPSA